MNIKHKEIILMNLIIIPVYNDWKSLNKLLFKINGSLDKKDCLEF